MHYIDIKMDIQSKAPHHWFDVMALDRPSSESSNAHTIATSAATEDNALMDHEKDKGKEIQKEKKKAPMWIGAYWSKWLQSPW